MVVLSEIFAECQSFLRQGGVVLWAILLVGVWLYSVLASTWVALTSIRQSLLSAAVSSANSERDIINDFTVFQLERLAWVDRRLPVIGVMVGVCSLGGLLGTVSGMLTTFENMAYLTNVDPMEKVASGISVALITTQAGLLIALPAAFLFALLQSRSKAVHSLLDRSLHSAIVSSYKGGAK